MSTNTVKDTEWESIFQEWSKSSQSKRSWCRENNIRYNRFLYWYHKLYSDKDENANEIGMACGETGSIGVKDEPHPHFIAVQIPGKEVNITPKSAEYGTAEHKQGYPLNIPPQETLPATPNYKETKMLRVNVGPPGLSIDVPEDYSERFLASLIQTLRQPC